MIKITVDVVFESTHTYTITKTYFLGLLIFSSKDIIYFN